MQKYYTKKKNKEQDNFFPHQKAKSTIRMKLKPHFENELKDTKKMLQHLKAKHKSELEIFVNV